MEQARFLLNGETALHFPPAERSVCGLMETALKLLLILAAPLSLAAQEAAISGAAADWMEALPVRNACRAVLVLDSPASTRLRAAVLPKAFPEKQTAGLLDVLTKVNEAGLTVEWLGAQPVTDFKQATPVENGMVRSTCRIGTTTITRTVICSRADDAVFIHLIADHPGALAFRVSMAGEKAKIEDRRQLILTPTAGPASHVWVLPFESDVTPEGGSIVVRGEGEALIVWNFSGEGIPASVISETLSHLGQRYDPGHIPADPSKIWQAVLAGQMKSIENSP